MLATLVILAVTLVPGVNVRRPYPGPYHPPRPAVLRHLAAAESLRVFRLGEEDFPNHGPGSRPGPGWLGGYRIVSEGRVDRAWRRRMVEILSDSSHYVQIITEFHTPELFARFGLRFSGGGRVTDVTLLPGGDGWTLWSGGRPEPSGYFEPDGREIVALLVAALPRDPVVRRLRPNGQLDPRDVPRDSLLQPGIAEYPQVIRRVAPEYPELARQAGVEGTVVVQVEVGRDGRVQSARVQRSVRMLDEAALVAARRWTFRPALDTSGRPTPCRVAIPIRFGAH